MSRVVLVGLAALLWGLLWALPAAAFNRPRKEPDIKPSACPEAGEGYVRIPGSSTCVKVSGLVRVEGAATGGSR
jgi:hypothetical protein